MHGTSQEGLLFILGHAFDVAALHRTKYQTMHIFYPGVYLDHITTISGRPTLLTKYLRDIALGKQDI